MSMFAVYSVCAVSNAAVFRVADALQQSSGPVEECLCSSHAGTDLDDSTAIPYSALLTMQHTRPAVFKPPRPCDVVPSHYLSTTVQTRAAEPSLRHEVTEVLDAMVATGLTVLRTWAFNDGESQWNALQPRPGVHASQGIPCQLCLLVIRIARTLDTVQRL